MMRKKEEGRPSSNICTKQCFLPAWMTTVKNCMKRYLYTIKTDVQEIGLVEMDWIDLAHNRDGWRAPVNVLMNLWVP